MALSYGQFFGTGSQENFDAPFEYLSKAHVKVRVNGDIVPFTWVSTYTVKVTPAPAMNAVVEVRRETPRDVRLVAFTDGSTLVETDLNTSTLQSFFLAQEAFDQGAASLAVTEDGAYSAGLRRISNVADPTGDQDVVTRKWATTSINSNVQQGIAAKNDAQTARTGAETARDAANSHRASALTHLNNTIAARDVAVAAKDVTVAAQADVTTRQADVTTKHGEVAAWRDLALGYRNETQSARDVGVAAKNEAVAAKDVAVGFTTDLFRQAVLSSPAKPSPVLADKVGILNSANGDATVQVTLSQLKTLLLGTSGVPTGAIAAFLDGAVPAGWAPLEGQTLSRTGETAALYALWGTKYGAGNGSSTFNVPDTRGESLRGWDNARGVDAGRALGSFQDQMVGPHTHALLMDAVPDHTHPMSFGAYYGMNSGSGRGWCRGDSGGGSTTLNTSGAGGHTPTGTVQSNGGTENRVRSIAVRWCVKL